MIGSFIKKITSFNFWQCLSITLGEISSSHNDKSEEKKNSSMKRVGSFSDDRDDDKDVGEMSKKAKLNFNLKPLSSQSSSQKTLTMKLATPNTVSTTVIIPLVYFYSSIILWLPVQTRRKQLPSQMLSWKRLQFLVKVMKKKRLKKCLLKQEWEWKISGGKWSVKF